MTHPCPQCQQPLSADAPDGLCPQCLMKAAAGPLPSTSVDGLDGCDIIDIGDPAEVAKKLPQFEILEMLGRGGMGVVYKARQPQLDRLVALKILPPVDALSADFVARFTREARALAKLNHPNIVNVYDFGETGGLYYIIMEYVEGANLRQLLQERKLAPIEALAIVPKICDALQYAHEEGLVHRDIKPENLLIDKKGRVKIADFGLAKLLRREPLDMTLTHSGMSLGTLRYMAPEQMDKPETVDHRADLYSLGVVIYEMLTGETPVGRFELPSQKAQVDVRFDEIVMRALEREPARRYQHASEVRDDVENVTGKPQSAPAAAPPPSAGDALLAQINARSIEMMIAGIALVISGVIGFIYGMVVASNYAVTNPSDNAATRAAFGALMFIPFFVCGIVAVVASLGMRKLHFHPFALVMSILLMLTLPGSMIANHGLPPQMAFFQIAFAFYAGLRAFLLLRKPEVESAFAANAPASSSQPALSICALIAAIWAPCVLNAWWAWQHCVRQYFDNPERFASYSADWRALGITAFFLALTAPLGATILAGSAIAKINHSAGKLYGLPLAAFALLFQPLVALALFSAYLLKPHALVLSFDGWRGKSPNEIAEMQARLGDALSFSRFDIVLVLAVCAFTGWFAWRKIAGPREASAKGKSASVETPAGAMLVAAVGNIAILVAFTMAWFPEASWSQHPFICTLITAIYLLYIVMTALIFRGTLKMLNREDYAASRLAAICSILSLNILSLPIGIWALIKLSKPEVKAVFAPESQTQSPTVLRWESWWLSRSRGLQKLMGILLGLILVLSLLGFFSFHMQVTTTADHTGVVRNLHDFTIGLGDPWMFLFHHKTGTRGALESGLNLAAGSVLFGIAAWCAGVAFTGLRREHKRRGADKSAPQHKFFWSAVASAVLFLAGVAGVIVHEVHNDDNGGLLADAVQSVHPDFTRPGVTSLALKKAIANELKLTPEQLEKINQSLNRHYLEFLELENEHSLYRSEHGHLVKVTKPFPDRSFALAQKLTADLRRIAGKEIIPDPERNAVWKLRLFRHAGEFNVRAELWEKEGKYHREETWERDGKQITGGKSGDMLDDIHLAFGTYLVDWQLEKDIIHEPKPDDAGNSYTMGFDVIQSGIRHVRTGELARMLAVKDPDAALKSGDPHAALVTRAGETVGRACAETQLKNHGIPFSKDASPEQLVTKLGELLGETQRP